MKHNENNADLIKNWLPNFILYQINTNNISGIYIVSLIIIFKNINDRSS